MTSRTVGAICALATLPALVTQSVDDGMASFRGVRAGEALVRAAYPELINRDHTLTASLTARATSPLGDVNPVFLSFSRSPNAPQAPGAQAMPPPVLDVLVAYRASGQVLNLEAVGSHVHSDVLGRVLERLSEAPSREVLEQELSKAGARYAPSARDAFMAVLRIERFEAALGRLSDVSAAFEWRYEKSGVVGTPFNPGWTVTARAVAADPMWACYTLRFEPITGRLRELRADRCR